MTTPTTKEAPAAGTAQGFKMAHTPAEVRSTLILRGARPRVKAPRRPPEIERRPDLGEGVYYVGSTSRPGYCHETNAERNTCTCESVSDWHRPTCRHLEAIKPLWLAEQARRAEEEVREAARRAAPVAAIQQRVVAQMGMLSPAQQATWRLLSDYGEGAVFGPEVGA